MKREQIQNVDKNKTNKQRIEASLNDEIEKYIKMDQDKQEKIKMHQKEIEKLLIFKMKNKWFVDKNHEENGFDEEKAQISEYDEGNE